MAGHSNLLQAVEGLHECQAAHVKDFEVKEEFNGQTAWEGVVSQFEVDHPETDTCYAWSSPIEGSSKRKFYAVLKIPPVETPLDAVRASIVSDHRSKS